MANYFQSVTAKFGVDTSDWSKGIANILNQAQSSAAQLQQIFRASGLRQAARFLGIGAPLFAAYESYQVAKQYVKELEVEQTKAIENIYKQINAFRGTDLYPQKLQEAQDAIAKIGTNLSETDKILLAGKVTTDSLSESFKNLGVRIVAGTSDLIRFGRALVVGHARGDISGALNEDTARLDADAQAEVQKNKNDATRAALDERDKQIRSEKKEQARIDRENLLDDVAGKPTDTQLAFYKKDLGGIQDKLANDQATIAKEAQDEEISGESKMQYYLALEAEDRRKIGELQKQQGTEQTEAATKLSELQERIQLAEEKHTELTKKDLGLTQEKAQLVKEGIQAELALNDIQDKQSDDYAKALEHVNELYEKYEAANERIAQSKARQVELENSLSEMIDKRSQQEDARLQRTDKEITSGHAGSGYQRVIEREYEAAEKKAQDEHDRADRDAAHSFLQNKNRVNPNDPLYNKSQAEYARARQLQPQADVLHGATGSKEGAEQFLTDATFKSETGKIQAELSDLKRIIAPALKIVPISKPS